MEPASTTPPQAVPGFVTADLLLAAIVDSSDDAIISKSLDSIVTSWNQGAERIFGYKEEEMIGRSITAIIPPDRLDEEPQIVARLKRGERVDHFDSVRIRKDGSLVSVSLTISPIRNEEGVIVGASKIARDITERKRAEELLLARKAELQRATDEAREAVAEAARQSRMKDEFLATLSHELRTPLQSILGWTQLLMAGECSEAELKQGLEVIDRNSRSQVRIIEDLLDMSSILSGKVKLDMQRVELKPIIAAAVETVMPAAQAKGIRLESAYHEHAAQHVIGDGGRLQQVFWNLLINAIKFTPSGGMITVRTGMVNSSIEISVEDSGAGIPPEFLPHAFERFRQSDSSTTRRHGGLGLGLAIVKHLTELHGGYVRAESEGVGMGATFTVGLPVLEREQKPVGQDSPAPQQEASLATPRMDKISVLVVDDEEDARNLVAKLLSKAGANVRTAGSADEAFSLLRLAVPDVLVSDIGMPEQDGYALIRTIRNLPEQEGGRVPALALSAYSRLEDRIVAISAGFQMHLSKPADATELLMVVESLARNGKQPT